MFIKMCRIYTIPQFLIEIQLIYHKSETREKGNLMKFFSEASAPKGGSWRNAPRGVNRAEYTLPTKKTAPRFAMLFFGGKRWIRTTEGGANRFTVCSLWPLGNLPTLGAGGRSRTNNLLITNQLLCH